MSVVAEPHIYIAIDYPSGNIQHLLSIYQKHAESQMVDLPNEPWMNTSMNPRLFMHLPQNSPSIILCVHFCALHMQV